MLFSLSLLLFLSQLLSENKDLFPNIGKVYAAETNKLEKNAYRLTSATYSNNRNDKIGNF